MYIIRCHGFDFATKFLINTRSTCSKSWFNELKLGPPDVIFGVIEAYKKDKNEKKVNVGVGAYRDDNSNPWVLPSVRMAEERIVGRKLNKEYATILGIPEFFQKATELAYGCDSPAIKENRLAATQSISGTGGIRVGAAFLGKFWPGCRQIWIPNPTWGNHMQISEHSGLIVKRYRYYDIKKNCLAFKSILEDINKMPETSIIILHAVAHNPTGTDPTLEQWCEISELIKKKNIFPFFDMAYQGFASGDIDRDAQALRLFEQHGHSLCMAQSFAKNMGLYGERAGTFSIICGSEDEKKRILSQIKILIRALYSNPPIHGARIVLEILSNDDLKKIWLKDVKTMSERIFCIRKRLKEELKKVGSKHNWDHITNQIGMFCYSGLNPEQVQRLTKEFSIYLTKDGRISVAGVTNKNVEYMAQAIHTVTK